MNIRKGLLDQTNGFSSPIPCKTQRPTSSSGEPTTGHRDGGLSVMLPHGIVPLNVDVYGSTWSKHCFNNLMVKIMDYIESL